MDNNNKNYIRIHADIYIKIYSFHCSSTGNDEKSRLCDVNSDAEGEGRYCHRY